MYLGCGELQYPIQGESYSHSLWENDTHASQLPGHKGTVTTVDFHPKEPISMFSISIHKWANYVVPVLTGSKDATMLLGEIEAGLSI